MELTLKERLSLANQYRILALLDEKEGSHYARMVKVLEHGWELHYDDATVMFEEQGLTGDECRWVMDVLDMYNALRHSHGQLNQADQATFQSHELEFDGFDGNHDREYAYARYLVLDEQRWTEVLDGRPNFDLNSHSQGTRPRYLRMLDVWQGLQKKSPMNARELRSVVDT